MPRYPSEIEYSERYADDSYIYRHVLLPKAAARMVYDLTLCQRLLTEDEWRGLGVQMSIGWVHYEIHRPEPHILLFRRSHPPDPVEMPEAVILTLHFEPLDDDGFLTVASTTMGGDQVCSVKVSPLQQVGHLRAELGAKFDVPSVPGMMLPGGHVLRVKNDNVLIVRVLESFPDELTGSLPDCLI